MATPLTQSDLIFPTQSLSLSSTLSSLKRSALSTTNRLTSITSDAAFVISVSEAYGLPLVANERCGSWYIPPDKKTQSAYFKSTDGHMNEWSFSLRRLNLQVLDVVGAFGGCVIVDSTRRGKSMPDALSKTIPIWCCVLNRALFSGSGTQELYTPPQAVSASEHAQIEKRIHGFVRQFLDICKPDVRQLRTKVHKPLRPIWVTQTASLPENAPTYEDFHPVILCTASRRVHGAEGSEGGYIQGAADDHEAWARGLTPSIFWNHKHQLLNTNEDELPTLIEELVKGEANKEPDAVPILVKPTKNLYISTTRNLDIDPFDAIISCGPEAVTTTNPEHIKTKKYLHLRCQNGKLGSRDLRTQLAHLPAFFTTLQDPLGKILVCCPTGTDLSVGVALAILCLYTADDGKVAAKQLGHKNDKRKIKQRLAWLTTTAPTLNPPRGTLQSVNAFLMPDPSASPPLPPSAPPYRLVLAATTHEPTTETDAKEMLDTSVLSKQTALFTSLLNKEKTWSFSRTLTSRLPSHPSGTVKGTATFTLYHPTSQPTTASPPHPNPETKTEINALLYTEEGVFTTSSNQHFTTRRKYIYTLSPPAPSISPDSNSTPTITVHFAEQERGEEGGIGGVFVEMGELVAQETEGEGVLRAENKAQHLCGEDLYTATWRFGRGLSVEEEKEREEAWWEVRYVVEGPRKDYVSETRYTRV